MVAGYNYNIQTRSVNTKGATGSGVAIGSSVAAGMTRYVTFISISPKSAASGKGRKIWFCSTAATATASSTTLASTAAKLVYVQGSASAEPNWHTPRVPDTSNPLFTIAASKFLTARQSKTQGGSGSCSIFVQYYDQ